MMRFWYISDRAYCIFYSVKGGIENMSNAGESSTQMDFRFVAVKKSAFLWKLFFLFFMICHRPGIAITVVAERNINGVMVLYCII